MNKRRTSNRLVSNQHKKGWRGNREEHALAGYKGGRKTAIKYFGTDYYKIIGRAGGIKISKRNSKG